MSAFTDWTGFDPVRHTRKRYAVTQAVSWDIGRKGSGWVLTIRETFAFDVSTPRVFEWIVDPHNPEYLAASALHDALLIDGHDVFFASGEFRRALRARGIGAAKAFALYAATLAVTAWNRRS